MAVQWREAVRRRAVRGTGLLVALTANYTGFLAPKLALGSNILLMVLILLWRARGLYALTKR